MAKKLDLLDKRIPSWKIILLLAWPTIVEQILQTAVNYVDTAMVGSIGTHATAAIGVCTSTVWLIMGVMNAAAVGYSVMVARRIGESRTEDARTVQIPREFDAVYEAYNRMQKECGFDLQKYAGKKVELTTFRVTNWPSDEQVLVDVLVYKKKVIGGAVYTAAVDGFMQGLTPLNAQTEG